MSSSGMMTYLSKTPDDDILVENVWFLLIVYTPLLSFFLALHIHHFTF